MHSGTYWKSWPNELRFYGPIFGLCHNKVISTITQLALQLHILLIIQLYVDKEMSSIL